MHCRYGGAKELNSAFYKNQVRFWLDVINYAFEFTINLISLISIGSGAKEFYYRHIANASTLVANRRTPHATNKTL